MRLPSMRTLAVLAALATLATAAVPAHAAAQEKPKTTATHTHTLSGEITAYDDQSHTLTLKTSKGPTSFAVAEAKVYVASKSVGSEEMAKQVGATASVHYTTKNGQRAASSVRITPPKTTAHKS